MIMPNVTTEYLENYYHLPQTDAAKLMGIGTTTLKKLCRSLGIKRWPYRTVRKHQRICNRLEEENDIMWKNLIEAPFTFQVDDMDSPESCVDRIVRVVEELDHQRECAYASDAQRTPNYS